MPESRIHAVTGAFGYTGRYIAERLLERSERLITLTRRPPRSDPFGARVPVFPLDFENPPGLAAALEGVDTLYNTYWVRFAHGNASHEKAVAHSRVLLWAAARAGVRRVVHISVTNPHPASPLPYFRGKALVEAEIRRLGLSHAILRPALIFGKQDILLNNIAWLLRRLPLFAVPGDGRYRLQPIYVKDLAALAVQAGAQDENLVVDAIGPETLTFDGLVRLLAGAVGSRARLVHVPPPLALAAARVIGWLKGDVLLTGDEMSGLLGGLLVTDSPPAGETRLSDWARRNAGALGVDYASELARHFRAVSASP